MFSVPDSKRERRTGRASDPMRVLVQNTLTNRQWVAFDATRGFLIGRNGDCDVQLDSRFVAETHARVERNDGQWEIELLPGVNPVEIDGREYAAGQKVTIRGEARMRVMEFALTLSDTEQEQAAGAAGADLADGVTDLQNTLHAVLLRRLDLRLGAFGQGDYSAERTEKLN